MHVDYNWFPGCSPEARSYRRTLRDRAHWQILQFAAETAKAAEKHWIICVVSMKDSMAISFAHQVAKLAPPVIQQLLQQAFANACDDTVLVHPMPRAKLTINADYHRVGLMIDQVAHYGTPILIIGAEGMSVSSVRNGKLDRCVTPVCSGDHQLN